VTKAQFLAKEGAEIYGTIRHACRLARAAPAGPVMVEIPAEHYIFRHDVELKAPQAEIAPPSPRAEEIAQAAKLLAASERPLLYVGRGAEGVSAELVALAERLNSPVATTLAGKGVFNEKHSLWLWCGFGSAAPAAIREIAADCDLTLAIGCRFSEVGTGSYGLQPPGKLIHVDIDPAVFNKNYRAELAIAADGASFVSSLLQQLPARPVDKDLREAIGAAQEWVWREYEAAQESERVSPAHLLKTLQTLMGPDTIYTTDSGNGTFLAMECLRLEHPRSFLAPVDYSCMGYAVPAALGAALACPERRGVALAGDGAFLMTGLELLTAAQLQIPAMVLVLRDRELAQIAQFQQIALARKSCSKLPDYDLAMLCRGMGVEYLRLERNSEVASVLEQALAVVAAKKPVLVEVAIDYSQKTFFTRGVVRTNLGRLPWAERLRFVWRALARRLS
jgi:acetolactate synthase-1/2/3 large subunit